MIGDRSERILQLVAETYVDTARPVPSAEVARRLGVSSATVRSEFAALEEAGLLQQPHTSAGRLPTPAGFRRYAARFLPPAPLREPDLRATRDALAGRSGNELLNALATLASELSGYAVVLEVHVSDRVRALEVHLTPLHARSLLAVAVLEGGVTRELTVPLDPVPDADALDEAERTLRSLSLPLALMPPALHERATQVEADLARTLRALADAWPGLQPEFRLAHGLSRLLLEPESSDPDFVRRAAHALEQGSSDDPVPDLDAPLAFAFDEALARVAAPLPRGSGAGRLTLIGPTRMRVPRAFRVAHGLAAAGTAA